MAQLVEQLIRNQQVAGSSPATSSSKNLASARFFALSWTIISKKQPNCKYSVHFDRKAGEKMTFSMGEIKKLCKERGYTFRAASLFGISKNDSGTCDFFVETADTVYAVKVLTLGEDAERVYFQNVGGYITVKGASGETDYLWNKPDFAAKASGIKPAVGILLLDRDAAATELSKNRVVTVTPGAMAFGCRVHTPSSFAKLLG